MFKHQYNTKFPPQDKPVFVWDGQCGFCRYWIIRWKIISQDQFEYKTFQDSAAAFPDIPLQRFVEAVRFIETDGTIYSGPAAAYRSLYLLNKYNWLWQWYEKGGLFSRLSDRLYALVAANRTFFYKLTVILFGKNPVRFKPFWIIYLLALLIVLFLLIKE